MADSADQSDAVFRVEGDAVTASARAAGPWDPTTQHGGAPSALLAWAVERIPTPSPMQITRMTVDLMRPAPIGTLRLRSEIVREGRNIQLVQASLWNADKEVVRASVLRIRTEALDYAPTTDAPDAPPPDACPVARSFGSAGFGRNMDVREARGGVGAGPAAVWFRMTQPLIAGVQLTGAMRAMAAADFGNGVSMALDFTRFTFINADLSVHFWRAPEGEWILVDAATTCGDAGRGLTETRLADTRGYFGRAAQSLVIGRR